MSDDDLEEVVVEANRARGAAFQPYDLGGIAAALNAYMFGAGAAADPYGFGYYAGVVEQPTPAAPPPDPVEDPVETVVVAAPRLPAPAPPPRPPSLLDDLLTRPVGTAPPPPSEFQRLLEKPPATEFEKLLEKPYRPTPPPPLAEVRVTASRIARAAGRFAGPLGMLGLLPTMYHAGVTLDELATDSWTRRLFGDGEPKKTKPARRPATPAGSADGDDIGEMPQVTVTGRTPRAPSFALPVLGVIPGMGDMVGTYEIPADDVQATSPRRVTLPIGSALLAPPGLEPLPAQFASPLPGLLPFAPPRPPGQTPSEPAPGRPPPRGPQAPPAVTWPGGVGAPVGCDCKATKNKPKPKKPRNVCWRGTYVEGPTSLKKAPRVRVSCATGEDLMT